MRLIDCCELNQSRSRVYFRLYCSSEWLHLLNRESRNILDSRVRVQESKRVCNSRSTFA